jgi:hypothetical protein
MKDRISERTMKILHLILISAALAGALVWLGRVYGFKALELKIAPPARAVR